MRTVRDVMKAHPVSVTPLTPVHSAVLLMRTSGALAMPVVDTERVVGVLDAATVFMYQPEVMVSEIMSPPAYVHADSSLSAAASLMRERGLAELPVLDGELIGTIKALDLLGAWAMPVDPLTNLPWQDSFRLRSSAELAAGKELTLLFFDLDDFGAVNKRFGHIVGDRALKTVAGAIREAMDPTLDQACRFGGDEFVVSTSRHRAEAIEWAVAIRDSILGLRIEGLDGHVGVSIGVSGGLRQGERPGTHGPSTLDDLINRASQASTLAKGTPVRVMSLDHDAPHPAPPPPQTRAHSEPARVNRIRIRSVTSHFGAAVSRADVSLEHTGVLYTGTHEGPAGDAPQVVAEATANALAGFLPPDYAIRPTSIAEQVVPQHDNVMMAVVSMDGPDGRQNLVGVADVASDAPRAVVKAILDAVNRPLEAIELVSAAAERMVNGNGAGAGR